MKWRWNSTHKGLRLRVKYSLFYINVEWIWESTPKVVRLRVKYSLTCLEVTNVKIYEFILPRDWGLQRGEYFSDLSGGHECEDMILYSRGTEAEGGIYSDLSGGHEYVEYMSLYSQGTEDCREGSTVFSDLSGGHECEDYMSLYSQGTEDCREGSIFWPVWRSWMWRIYEFILPRGWGLQRGEYFLTSLEVMNVKNI
jgi:hypothetical protein